MTKPGTTPSATRAWHDHVDARRVSTTTGPTPSADAGSEGGEATAAGAKSTDSGSPTTLLAGLGLVGLVGAGAAYLAVRRRATG